MRNQKRIPWLSLIVACIVVAIAMSATTFADDAEEAANVSKMYATFWSLVPPLVAIVLALITKEVYSSLFVGIVIGALFYTNFSIKNAYLAIFTTDVEGSMISVLTAPDKVGILLFLVVLGILVVLMNKAGGSAAYGRWASSYIKTRRGAQLATILFGCLIFVDDYFNCLTVGNVMRPITDQHHISRAKLAYIIDATAAPVCIIAPISSWAAAVAGVVPGMNGYALFVRTIPYNFYALLTITAMIVLTVTNTDFGPMLTHERNAQLKGDLYTTPDRPYADAAKAEIKGKGKVSDLVVPVLVLILFCIIGLIYTGDFFKGASFIDSFANCDASVGLALGSVAALIFAFFWFILRRILKFNDFMAALPEGFKAMVPAMLILIFAWTLSGMTGMLGAAQFVEHMLKSHPGALIMIPLIVFLVAIFLSFSTGTSWGTFGILLPVVVPLMPKGSQLLIITVAATLAGAVCGDHCSPISDTTIMASTGAQCNHINHVSTQLPYALVVAAVSGVNFMLAALIQNWFINLPIAVVSMIVTVLVIRRIYGKKELSMSEELPEAKQTTK